MHLSSNMDVWYIGNWRLLVRTPAGAFVNRRFLLCWRLFPTIHGSWGCGGGETNHALESAYGLEVGVAKDGHSTRAARFVVLCATAPLESNVSGYDQEIWDADMAHYKATEERHGDELWFPEANWGLKLAISATVIWQKPLERRAAPLV